MLQILMIGQLGLCMNNSDDYTITTTAMSGGGGLMTSTSYQLNCTLGQPSPLMEQGMDPDSGYCMDSGTPCRSVSLRHRLSIYR